MYALGVDLGTTYTAAAVWRGGRGEVVSLGGRTATIPSVVLLREDGTYLVGDAASRRGMNEPDRVAREFKRRLGDAIPILLGERECTAEELMAQLLRTVVDNVVAAEGGPPAQLCLSHPANWGHYKIDLLRRAVQLAGVEQPVTYTTEPEAAAAFYAQQQRVEPGAMVAVYDLGGGTFDAAILRKTQTGFEIIGQPEGIEHLGGVDFDAVVLGHVREALGDRLDELDEEDPAAVSLFARLREECVAAKETLSSDTDVSIPVLLPSGATEVRLTRAEFESKIRPALHSTIEALRRAVASAQVPTDQLQSVLLVGGASRMPIVAQLVGAELDRPVTVDAHPKHAVALGAAAVAAGPEATAAPRAAAAAPPPVNPVTATAPVAKAAPVPPPPAPTAPPVSPAPPVPVSPAVPAAAGTPRFAPGSATPRAAGAGASPAGAGSGSKVSTPQGSRSGSPASPYAPPSPALAGGRPPAPPGPPRRPGGPAGSAPPRRWRRALLIAAVVIVAVLGTSGIAVAMLNQDGDGDGQGGSSPGPSPSASRSESPSPSPTPDDDDDDDDDDGGPVWPPSDPPSSPAWSPSPTASPSPDLVTVPDVHGYDCLWAYEVLRGDGFEVIQVTNESVDDPVVTDQDPWGGAEAEYGSTVRITCDAP